MNKFMILCAFMIAIILINSGVALRTQAMDVKNQQQGTALDNRSLMEELSQKQVFKKSDAKTISNAFTVFVNQTRMFETYSGTRMNIVFSNSKENENIEDYYVDTSFRNVKGLPLMINIDKFSNETDMAEVLNDIYLLENRTDFKVSEIESENNDLTVKGELYGI